MPRYDYGCTACDYTAEITHSISEADEVRLCPLCDLPLQRGFTPTPTHFKGEGFASNAKQNGGYYL